MSLSLTRRCGPLLLRSAFLPSSVALPTPTALPLLPSPLLPVTQVRSFATPKRKAKKYSLRGSRGSRGLGWFQKYREGLGGRHLEPFGVQDAAAAKEWNDKVFEIAKQNGDLAKIWIDVGMPTSESEEPEGSGGAGESEIMGRIKMSLISPLLPVTTAHFCQFLSSPLLSSTSVNLIEKRTGVIFGQPDWLRDDLWDPQVFNSDGSVMERNDAIEKYHEGEAYLLDHEEEGILTMARLTKGGISPVDFIITCGPATRKHMNGIQLPFGRVDEGFEVVQEISEQFTMKGRPKEEMRVVAAGVGE